MPGRLRRLDERPRPSRLGGQNDGRDRTAPETTAQRGKSRLTHRGRFSSLPSNPWENLGLRCMCDTRLPTGCLVASFVCQGPARLKAITIIRGPSAVDLKRPPLDRAAVVADDPLELLPGTWRNTRPAQPLCLSEIDAGSSEVPQREPRHPVRTVQAADSIPAS